MLRETLEYGFRFHEAMGPRIASFAPKAPTVAFDMQADLTGIDLHRRLHGGVIAAARDAVGFLAIMMALAEKHPSETAAQVVARLERVGAMDLRVDDLRQGTGRRFEARGKVMRRGSRNASARMALTNDEARPIATGAAIYVVR